MAEDRSRRAGRIAGALSGDLGVYAAVLGLAAIGAACFPSRFLTAENILNTLDSVVLLGIVAVGMAFVTYSGHYADLSVPSTMAFSGIVAVEALRFGFLAGIAAGLATGTVIGLINALVVGKIRANPIIWTLAVCYVGRGLMRWLWLNRQIYPDVKGGETNAGELFTALYRCRTFGGIPVGNTGYPLQDVIVRVNEVLTRITLPMVVLAVVIVVGQILLKRTTLGRQLKLTGANQGAAKASGVHLPGTIGAAFLISALTSSIAGILITSLSKVGAYYNGEGYDFDAVTAVVIGGVTLAGGRGSIIGVLGGVLVLGLMSNLMTLMGVGTFSQRIAKGIVFIVVVWISSAAARKTGGDDA